MKGGKENEERMEGERREEGREGGQEGERKKAVEERGMEEACWNSIMEYQKLKYLGVGETWATVQHMWLAIVQRGKWTNQITRPSVSGL